MKVQDRRLKMCLDPDSPLAATWQGIVVLIVIYDLLRGFLEEYYHILPICKGCIGVSLLMAGEVRILSIHVIDW